LKKLLQFEPGETIIKEGDDGESAYLIESGSVEVSRSVGDRKVLLATLGAGEIFGEMSMIDDAPRGATITAASETTVSEMPREEFLDHLKDEPEFAVRFLKTIFERFRDANVRILQLEQAGGGGEAATAVETPPAAKEAPPADRRLTVTLEGLTPQAIDALPENPYRVEHLPFLVGRACPDPLVHNHLNIEDEIPWQISRHHLKFVNRDGAIAVIDRGSTLGSIVDGREMGGRFGPLEPIVLKEPEGELVMGVEHSPYRYKVRIEEA
jgi:CRP-like cAMP-binding protein